MVQDPKHALSGSSRSETCTAGRFVIRNMQAIERFGTQNMYYWEVQDPKHVLMGDSGSETCTFGRFRIRNIYFWEVRNPKHALLAVGK